jgi:hypothetical protein
MMAISMVKGMTRTSIAAVPKVRTPGLVNFGVVLYPPLQGPSVASHSCPLFLYNPQRCIFDPSPFRGE